jgi:Holliday junction resolvasome RuvABC endonuclease subunit
MIIAGLDVATHMGVAIWVKGIIVHRAVIHFPPEAGPVKGKGVKRNDPSRFTRYEKYGAAVEDLLTQWAVTDVYVEGYGYANANSLVTLVELGTTVRQVLYDSGLTWHEVAPGVLKKFLTGSGNSPKDKMLLEVYKRFGIECANDDEADAVALAFFGAAHKGCPVKLPTAQLALATGYTAVAKPKKPRKNNI